jgi:hypothetical protein
MNDYATQIRLNTDKKGQTLQIVLNKPASYAVNSPHSISILYNAALSKVVSLRPIKSSQSFTASLSLKDIPAGTKELIIKYGDELFHQQVKAIKKDDRWIVQ